MRKLVIVLLLLLPQFSFALDRQPNADYRARRQAVAGKTDGGVVLLFAPVEADGPDDLYGFRQDDNFFYLTGWKEPGAALLIAAATPAKDQVPARPYTEILFLPAHNVSQEKWTGAKLGPENPDAPKITGFDRVEVLDELRTELVHLFPQGRATVYTDVRSSGENSRFNPSAGMAETGQRIPVGGFLSGCASAAGDSEDVQRFGRDRTDPQGHERVDGSSLGGDARDEAGNYGAGNLSFAAVRMGKARL